jgi:hypothetical protein
MSVTHEHFLVQYIHKGGKRFNRGQLRGCLYAYRKGGRVQVGWSLCNKTDRFDKMRGFFLAKFLAIHGQRYTEEIPDTIQRAIKHTGFLSRCRRYFKVPVVQVRSLESGKEL